MCSNCFHMHLRAISTATGMFGNRAGSMRKYCQCNRVLHLLYPSVMLAQRVGLATSLHPHGMSELAATAASGAHRHRYADAALQLPLRGPPPPCPAAASVLRAALGSLPSCWCPSCRAPRLAACTAPARAAAGHSPAAPGSCGAALVLAELQSRVAKRGKGRKQNWSVSTGGEGITAPGNYLQVSTLVSWLCSIK